MVGKDTLPVSMGCAAILNSCGFSPCLIQSLLKLSLPRRVISTGRRLSPGMAGAAGLSGLQFRGRRVMEKGTGLFWPPKPPLSTCQALVQTMLSLHGPTVPGMPRAPRTAGCTHHDFFFFQVTSFRLFSTACCKHMLSTSSTGSSSSAALHLARSPVSLFLDCTCYRTSSLILKNIQCQKNYHVSLTGLLSIILVDWYLYFSALSLYQYDHIFFGHYFAWHVCQIDTPVYKAILFTF